MSEDQYIHSKKETQDIGDTAPPSISSLGARKHRR